MKVVLNSDFIDYYDHWFDRIYTPEVHLTFNRKSIGVTPRLELLDYMSSELGLAVPEFGTVKEVANRLRLFDSATYLVVYTDDMKHRGDGKEKVSLKSALKRFPNKPCSLYLPPDEKSKSYRLLSIGRNTTYLMSYQSTHSWKSNVGEVGVKMVDGVVPLVSSPHYPLFSIDFVVSNGIPYAVDFNSAPGIGGTPVEEVLEGQEIVKEIKTWMIASMS